MGLWMRRAGAELIGEADVTVPVPLHWTRLFARRYNQAAVLAQALRAAGGPPVAPDALMRTRRTPPQGKGNRDARRRNVAAAFAVSRAATSAARACCWSTMCSPPAPRAECARVLKRRGAARVDALTLARTVRDGA